MQSSIHFFLMIFGGHKRKTKVCEESRKEREMSREQRERAVSATKLSQWFRAEN